VKALGWALLAAVGCVGNMLGDLGLISTSDARAWGFMAVICGMFFVGSGERS